GSVIPLFLEQRKTGTVTVTDERMTRFWITLEQGVALVIRAAELMHGGEIFVPKIPSMRVVDLAAAIAPECKVMLTGIRPGEKLHEALLSDDETQHALEFENLYVVQPSFPWWGGDRWQDGRPVGEIKYTSDNNADWLTTDDLIRMADGVDGQR
ncbi:MAG TPA: polysaccharide biosynthesis protein, partial [Vicinamibacterales bacterium]|nr:polysaccharide biosynthesis protein [Vicinamibacterales bacterium]